MDVPECKDLKVKYDNCMKTYVKNQFENWDVRSILTYKGYANQCDEVFDVSYLRYVLGPCLFNIVFFVVSKSICLIFICLLYRITRIAWKSQ